MGLKCTGQSQDQARSVVAQDEMYVIQPMAEVNTRVPEEPSQRPNSMTRTIAIFCSCVAIVVPFTTNCRFDSHNPTTPNVLPCPICLVSLIHIRSKSCRQVLLLATTQADPVPADWCTVSTNVKALPGDSTKLTRKTQVVSKVRLHHVLAKDGALWPRCYRLLADGEADHGRNLQAELHEGGLLAASLLQDALVDVLGNVVTAVHGRTAALDARELGQVAGAEVVLVVGRTRLEAQTTDSERLSRTAIEKSYSPGLNLDIALLIEGRGRQV